MTRKEAYEMKRYRDRTGKTKHKVCKAMRPKVHDDNTVTYHCDYVLVLLYCVG